MKYNTIILLLIIPSICFGQLKEFLSRKEPNLTEWTIKSDNSAELKQLKAEGHLDDYLLDDNHDDDFHLIDFNSDGLLDILFYGYAGGESKMIAFFLNSSNSYQNVFSVMGKLVFISSYDGIQPLSFAINHYGCCASIVDVFEYYTPINNADDFGFQLSTKISFRKGLELPEDYITPVAFKTVNAEYKLRSKPNIDNESENPEGSFSGNVVAIYPPNSMGTAIAKKTDDTGRVWYLAIMKNNIKPIKEDLFKGYNNDVPHHSLGWLSSRYVEEY